MELKIIQQPNEIVAHASALRAARILAVDLETTGLDPHTSSIRLIQLAAEGLPVLIIDAPSFLSEPDGVVLLREILAGPAVKVFQNAKFDLQFLMALGIYPKPLFDTMLAAQLLYMPGLPRRSNLGALAEAYLGEKIDKREQKGDWSRETLTESQIEYAAKDAEILLRLRQAMVPQLKEADLARVAEIEFACVRAIAQIEYRGIHIDIEGWQALAERTITEKSRALEALYAFTGRPMAQTTLWGEDAVLGQNFDSNPFVLDLLHRNGIMAQATAKHDLYPFRMNPLVQALTAYRKASKALSALLTPTAAALHPVTACLHPWYGQIAAYSGRMSCSGPNIQQIPRDPAFRACFTAPAGRSLIIADYSQIELRVAAQISKDERMLEAYRQGEDLHLLTAALMTGKPMDSVTKQERQAAKAVNFGLVFGMGAAGLQQYAQQTYGVEMTADQAVLFRSRFFAAYKGIAGWHQRLKDYPPAEGHTLAGRRYALSKEPSLPELSNGPVQGTAADIVKMALGMLADRLEGTDTWIVGVVHDEVLLECPTESAAAMAVLLKDTMEAAANNILPLVRSSVEAVVSSSWADK